jgi:hypothetical protein
MPDEPLSNCIGKDHPKAGRHGAVFRGLTAPKKDFLLVKPPDDMGHFTRLSV